MSGPVTDLIPHRPPMRWIDELIDCTESTATATACFGADHFAVAEGFVLEPALVECVAQTVAAALGFRARSRGPLERSGSGMLAAVSGFRIQARVPAGAPLRISVRELRRFGPMLSVSGVVTSGDQEIARGDLTLYA